MLSIILPSYRAAAILRSRLPDFLQYLREHAAPFEVIVVDDGSDDGGETERVARDLGCRFLRHERNVGKGAAVRLGMKHAAGDILMFTDADIPYDYEAIPRFIQALRNDHAQIAIGDRTLPGAAYVAPTPVSRRIGSAVFSFIVGRLMVPGQFDTQCGLKVFLAPVAADIFACSRVDGFAFDVELLYVARMRKYQIMPLPVRLECQEESTVRVFFHGMVMVWDLLRIHWNHFRGRYDPGAAARP